MTVYYFSRRIKYALASCLAVVAAIIFILPTYAQGANLLRNGGFEWGSYAWNGDPSVQVPLEWELSWAQDGYWGKPSAEIRATPGSVLTRDGASHYMIYTQGAPVFAQLRQTVGGLTPGEIYNLTIPIFPEMVVEYRDGQHKVYSEAGEAVRVQLRLFSGDAEIFNSGMLGADSVPVGRWSRLNLNFAPTTGDIVVQLELIGAGHTHALNAFYLDGFSLSSTGLISPQRRAELAAQEAAAAEAALAGQQAAAAVPAAAPAAPVAPATYTVQSGDNLTRIATKLGVDVHELISTNNITNVNLLYAGMVLQVPGSAPPPAPVAAPVAAAAPAAVAAPAAAAPQAAAAPVAAAAPRTHTVQGGDMLARIASQYGVSYQALLQINNITNPNVIYPGQVLQIP